MSDSESSIRSVEGPTPTILAAGDLDFRVADEFLRVAAELLDRHDAVVLELNGVSFIDSSGVGALLTVRKLAEDKGKRAEIRGIGPCVRRALQASGLAASLGVDPLRLETVRSPKLTSSEMRRANWQISESVVVGQPVLVAGLRQTAVDAAQEAGLSDADLSDVKLAVGEALTNALRHGLQPGRDRIRLRCMSCPAAFVVEVLDQGSGFDPDAIPALEPGAADAGLGLRLMRSAMDEVDFTFNDRGSKVRMLKWVAHE